MYNILICDDEKDIVAALKIYLKTAGYGIYEAYNGREALEVVRHNDIHLILMDVMMPEMDGITAMIKIREEYNLPIIMLTAKSEDTDKILGLEVGADDYVTKPFNPVEVIARVKSQLRRYMQLGSGQVINNNLAIGGIELDDKSKQVTVDGDYVNLTPTEYEILKLLIKNPGRVYAPKEIYKQVWHEEPMGAEAAVAVHIRHLREKIEIDPSNPRYIQVIWGRGYKMEEHG
jgi:DNA-binding response OmpR family regulator